mgnify:CR=1 FL=1
MHMIDLIGIILLFMSPSASLVSWVMCLIGIYRLGPLRHLLVRVVRSYGAFTAMSGVPRLRGGKGGAAGAGGA